MYIYTLCTYIYYVYTCVCIYIYILLPNILYWEEFWICIYIYIHTESMHTINKSKILWFCRLIWRRIWTSYKWASTIKTDGDNQTIDLGCIYFLGVIFSYGKSTCSIAKVICKETKFSIDIDLPKAKLNHSLLSPKFDSSWNVHGISWNVYPAIKHG